MTHTDDDPPNADRIPSGDIWEMKAARKGTDKVELYRLRKERGRSRKLEVHDSQPARSR